MLDVTLCMDNGDKAACSVFKVDVIRVPVGISASFSWVPGRTGVIDGRILWAAPGLARVWNWEGRLLWEGRGRSGESRELPDAVLHSLAGRRARLEILP